MFKHKYTENGQGLVEYALIVILIAMVIVVTLSLVPPPVANVFNSVALTLGSM
jgi:pilus assembly protein Flp/PilA